MKENATVATNIMEDIYDYFNRDDFFLPLGEFGNVEALVAEVLGEKAQKSAERIHEVLLDPKGRKVRVGWIKDKILNP